MPTIDIDSFCNEAAAFVTRTRDSFVRNGVDVMLSCANRAKLAAQLEEDFHLCKYQVSLEIDTSAGADIGDAILWEPSQASDDIPVSIKKLEAAYLVGTRGDSQVIGTPMPIYNRFVDYEAALRSSTNSSAGYFGAKQAVLQRGNTVYLTPAAETQESPVEVAFDAVIFLPEYSADHTDDFFLREGRNWMLMKMISYLNFYLKEDERVTITDTQLQREWNVLMRWNASICLHREVDLK